MSTITNVETLAKAAKELMLKEPFYGLLLMALNKIWDKNLVIEGQGTAGVSLKGINYELHIEPEFWAALPALQKMGVLKHELLHIGFFHLTDYASYEDKKLLNVAMDLEINQYIDKSWLPEWACFLEKFPELNLEEKKGTRYYYQKLVDAKQQQQGMASALVNAICNGGQGGQQPNPNGQGGQNPDPNGQQGNGGMIQLPNGQTIQDPPHHWEAIESLPEATRKLIESQTKHIVTQVAEQVEKSRGTVPGEFAELIKRLLTIEPPKFDWKGYIRRFVGASTKTYTKKSRRKYNKRIPENPGLKIKRQKHMLVALDTSASVSTTELKEFLREMYHMKKTGSEVSVIQCDVAIRDKVRPFDPKKDFDVNGRGGTDFQPVIDYYNEHIREYSCLIYCTDGEAPAPENARGNILWVHSQKSAINEDLPGHKIRLDL